MKNKILKIIQSAILITATAFMIKQPARADFTVGTGTLVTVATNSATGLTPTLQITLPPIYESITFTNNAQVVTNNICFSSASSQSSPLVLASYVFRASDWGITNASIASPATWTTNYPAQVLTLTNYLFLQAATQTGGTNNPTIQAH